MSAYCWFIVHIWIIMCTGITEGVLDGDMRTIWCLNDNVRNNPNLLKSFKNEDIACEAARTKDYPFDTADIKRTAPVPRSIQSGYKTYKTMDEHQTMQIAVYTTWTYKVQDLDLAEKFHIELTRFIPYGGTRQYYMNWDKNKTSDYRETSGLIKFGFIYSGKPGNYHIHPSDLYSFKIQACPIYHEDKLPQVVKMDVKIPNCTNPKIYRTKVCVNKRKEARKRKDEKRKRKRKQMTAAVAEDPPSPLQEKELDPLVMVFLMLGGAVLIVLVGAVAWCSRKWIKSCFVNFMAPRGDPGQKRVVFVCSSDKTFLKPINQFINLFTKFAEVEIVCNLRQSNEIGQQGIPEWMKKNVYNASMVVFLVADPNELKSINHEGNNERDTNQVGMALKAAEKMIFAAEYDGKKFIAIDLKDCSKKEDLAYFTRFKFPRDFDKFAKLLVRDVSRIDASRKGIFLASLQIAKLGGYDGELHAENESEVRVEVENFNNLDNPPAVESEPEEVPEQEGCDQNILLDSQPPSVESNRTDSYLTTDFNNDQTERYNQAGARPKVRS